MVNIIRQRRNLSTKNDFVFYDWRDSANEDYYFNDKIATIYFFIKDLHPTKILEDIFINQMRNFKFKSGLEPKERISGEVVNSNLKYLFASFDFPRTAEFNWSREKIPIKRNPKLSQFKKESDLMKYLSKYIDD